MTVTAQSGCYAPGQTNRRKFIVEGERALLGPRGESTPFAGEVIEKQIEVVNE
jgi:hypothetical protein